jgi:6-phosphogluconolactonase (cycloisomerase 2 family)
MKVQIGCLAALMGLVGGLAHADRSPIVLIESNQGDQNMLLSFALQNDGSLQALASTPTGGKGVVDPSLALGPFDSDQQIILNRERDLLLAVNGGSNSISAFHIAADGSLMAIPGSPFNSDGVQPVSLGLKGNQLIVVNKHQDPAQSMDASLPNYVTFAVKDTGELQPTGHQVDVAAGSSPSQALISPLANVMVGADFLGGLLRSFVVTPSGALTQVSTMGISENVFANSSTPRLPLGLAAHPTQPVVYVGLPTANKIAVYKYDIGGKLQFVSATADSGQVVCWLLTNREGTRLYASNTGDPSLTVYDIKTDPLNPRELQKIKLNSMGGAYQIALSPDQKYFVVLTQRYQAMTPQGNGNELHVLHLDHGGLLVGQEQITNLALPQDVRPQGLVIF